MKDFLKKLGRPQADIEDLDAGYDNEYYQGAGDRRDTYREERPDDRRPDDRRSDDRRDYERYDRYDRDDRYDRRPDDRRQDDRRQDDRRVDDRRVDDRRSDDRYAPRGWEEPVAPAYRGRVEEPAEPVFEPAPAPEYLYFTPATYRDCREGIVRGFAAGHVVVVRLVVLESADVLRLFDYMMGAVLALDGELVRVQATTVVLLPKDVELDENELELDDEDEDDEEDDEDYDDENEYDGYDDEEESEQDAE